MRAAYVITYDISDDKRLRKVHKLMRGYGEHLQYSVFRCELNRQELAQLKGRLALLIRPTADQVLFIHLGPADGRGGDAITALGKPYVCLSQRIIVV